MRAEAVSLPRDRTAREAAAARLSVSLAGGAQTTVHVAPYELAHTEVRTVVLRRPETLLGWCSRRGVTDAIVGGFFIRSTGRPLGEVRTRGIRRVSRGFLAPFDRERACVHIRGGHVTIARRPDVPARPRGDLLQAGPLLVAGGEPVVRDGEDPEGFSAGSRQFDTDITEGRHPRAALAIARGMLLAVVCDGRSPADAGMTLGELAVQMAELGAEQAINLDGGGSASLVCDGELLNQPRELEGTAIPGGRPIVTALTFSARA
jgi:Phosphodiester glycosidase